MTPAYDKYLWLSYASEYMNHTNELKMMPVSIHNSYNGGEELVGNHLQVINHLQDFHSNSKTSILTRITSANS